MQTLLIAAAVLLTAPGSGVGSLGHECRVHLNAAVRDAIQRGINAGPASGEASLERIPPQKVPVPKK